MTAIQSETLRDAISAGLVGYSDIWAAITESARDLAEALAAQDLEGAERAARFVADLTAWLGRAQ